MRADVAPNHGAALADGRGGITTAHGFSLADQEDGATMTTWAHLTELFSSLPWFKMRDPRGVARKIYGVRAMRRRASLHIKFCRCRPVFWAWIGVILCLHVFFMRRDRGGVSTRGRSRAICGGGCAVDVDTRAPRALACAAVVRDIIYPGRWHFKCLSRASAHVFAVGRRLHIGQRQRPERC